SLATPTRAPEPRSEPAAAPALPVESFFVDEEETRSTERCKGSPAPGATVRRQTALAPRDSVRRRTEGPPIPRQILELCASGLTGIGHAKGDARERVRDAWRRLQA